MLDVSLPEFQAAAQLRQETKLAEAREALIAFIQKYPTGPHLEEAKERNAGVIDIGDLACAMQGRFDPRADKSQLRPELQSGDYFDALTRYNAAFYEPYAEHFVMLSRGNHEELVLQKNQTDLSERLAERLRAKGSQVVTGTYQGWVRFMFTVHANGRHTVRMRYTHGYGGGGPVTRDVIQSARQMVYIGNADILLSGHTHDAWSLPIRREILLDSGRPVLRDVEVVKTGGYKCEYAPGSGWAVGKGHPPKPLGAYWLRFYLPPNAKTVSYEVQRAK